MYNFNNYYYNGVWFYITYYYFLTKWYHIENKIWNLKYIYKCLNIKVLNMFLVL